MSRWHRLRSVSFRACFLSLLSIAGAWNLAAAAGHVEFDSKVYEAGDVDLGEVIEHDFVIRNTGDEPVNLTAVRPSCACTVPHYPPVLQPGEEGVIRIAVDTKTLSAGKLTKTVTINTDAPNAQRVILKVNMVLVTPLEFLPKALVYMRTVAGAGGEEEVLVRPHRKGMAVVGASSDNANILVEMVKAEGHTGDDASPQGGLRSLLLPRQGDYWLKVRLKDDTPVGLHRAVVTVKTNDSDYPEAVLKVNAAVAEPKAP